MSSGWERVKDGAALSWEADGFLSAWRAIFYFILFPLWLTVIHNVAFCPLGRIFHLTDSIAISFPSAWEGQEKGLQLDSIFLTTQSQLFRISFLSVVIARRNKPQIYRAD